MLPDYFFKQVSILEKNHCLFFMVSPGPPVIVCSRFLLVIFASVVKTSKCVLEERL